MTSPAVATTPADQVAAELRDRRTQHDGEVCDVLFGLCAKCRADLAIHAELRIPEQRRPA